MKNLESASRDPAARAKTELVIFDCDGVLVDSEVIAVEIDHQILSEHGWDLSREEAMERFLGTPYSNLQRQLEEFLGHSLPSGWEALMQERYAAAFEDSLQPVSGVHEALDRLTLPTCVASSSRPDKIRHSLELTGLLDRFDGRIFSASEVERGKPAPDLFLLAARRVGVEPSRCVVVEDSPFGIQAAHAAGMWALGYAGGLTPAAWLQAQGARVFTDMAMLPDLLSAN